MARAGSGGSLAVTGPRDESASASARAPSSCRPSLIHMMRSKLPRVRAKRSAASARSGRHGCGSRRAMRPRASAAVSASPASRAGFSGAVSSRKTGARARSASAAAADAAARACGQKGAEVQPLSITMSVRPPAASSSALGARLGRAKPDDHQCGGERAKQNEPERRAFAALFFGLQTKQQPGRRKRGALRRGRRRAQQPPQSRQSRERDQRPRRGEQDRSKRQTCRSASKVARSARTGAAL